MERAAMAGADHHVSVLILCAGNWCPEVEGRRSRSAGADPRETLPGAIAECDAAPQTTGASR